MWGVYLRQMAAKSAAIGLDSEILWYNMHADGVAGGFLGFPGFPPVAADIPSQAPLKARSTSKCVP